MTHHEPTTWEVFASSDKHLASIPETAKALGIDPRTVRRMIRLGQLPVVLIAFKTMLVRGVVVAAYGAANWRPRPGAGHTASPGRAATTPTLTTERLSGLAPGAPAPAPHTRPGAGLRQPCRPAGRPGRGRKGPKSSSAPSTRLADPKRKVEELREWLRGADEPSDEAHDRDRQALLNAVLAAGEAEDKRVGDVDLAIQAIRDQGGFTYDPKAARLVTVGFMVSLRGHELQVSDVANTSDRELKVILLKYFETARAACDGVHVGGWVNPDNGTLYLDHSVVVFNVAQARSRAEEHRQEAFWDAQAMQEIYTRRGDGA
jgi:hypothetical protein